MLAELQHEHLGLQLALDLVRNVGLGDGGAGAQQLQQKFGLLPHNRESHIYPAGHEPAICGQNGPVQNHPHTGLREAPRGGGISQPELQTERGSGSYVETHIPSGNFFSSREDLLDSAVMYDYSDLVWRDSQEVLFTQA